MRKQLRSKLLRQERDESIERFLAKSQSASLRSAILPYDVHEWCKNIIQNPAKRFAYRAEWTFENIRNAIIYLNSNIDSSQKYIIFGYNIENGVSALINGSDLVEIISLNSSFFSLDGIIISDINITSTFIFDYESANDTGSLSRVFCSVIGEMALNPGFPGANEAPFSN